MRSSQNRLNGATRHRQASDIHPAQNGKAPKLPFSSNASNSACLVLKNSISISRNWWPQYFVIKISFKLRSGVPKPKKTFCALRLFPLSKVARQGSTTGRRGTFGWNLNLNWFNVPVPSLEFRRAFIKIWQRKHPQTRAKYADTSTITGSHWDSHFYLFRIQKQSWLNNLF